VGQRPDRLLHREPPAGHPCGMSVNSSTGWSPTQRPEEDVLNRAQALRQEALAPLPPEAADPPPTPRIETLTEMHHHRPREGMAMRINAAAIQMPSEIGAVAGNLDRADGLLHEAAGAGAALAVLPEMALSGYGLVPDYAPLAEPADGPSIRHLRIAASSGAWPSPAGSSSATATTSTTRSPSACPTAGSTSTGSGTSSSGSGSGSAPAASRSP
jgi:hypothetical protein